MPHLTRKPHGRWGQRIVLGELELGEKYAAFKWRALRALYQRLPYEHVIFSYRACGDAFGWVGGEATVFFEETLRGGGGGHLWVSWWNLCVVRG